MLTPIQLSFCVARIRDDLILSLALAGAHWKDISGNLPNTPVNVVVINPNTPSEILWAAISVFSTRQAEELIGRL
jgi:hypothetical protein